MTKNGQIYVCELCENIVEIIHEGADALVCCGEDMKLLEEKTKDASTEKHVPYVEKTAKGVTVKVGQNEDHPMTGEHHIEWIQVLTDGGAYRKFLKPGEKPQEEFEVMGNVTGAREYCNLHGLWKS